MKKYFFFDGVYLAVLGFEALEEDISTINRKLERFEYGGMRWHGHRGEYVDRTSASLPWFALCQHGGMPSPRVIV
jgi:hypothetical protein